MKWPSINQEMGLTKLSTLLASCLHWVLVLFFTLLLLLNYMFMLVDKAGQQHDQASNCDNLCWTLGHA